MSQGKKIQRQLGVNQAGASKSMEKLSSGFRINRAADDAAGLSISEKMRGQIRGLKQASRNAQDGISLIQTAEGALNETHSILQRMRELVVQGGNLGTNQTADLTAIQDELDELTAEINGISERTAFNGKTLLDGQLAGANALTFQIGANQDQALTLEIGDMSATGLGLEGGPVDEVLGVYTIDFSGVNADVTIDGVTLKYDADGDGTASFKDAATLATLIGNTSALSDVYTVSEDANTISLTQKVGSATAPTVSAGFTVNTTTAGQAAGTSTGIDVTTFTSSTDFDTAVGVIDQAIEDVSAERSKLGANQNRLEHTISNLDNARENLQAAESRIRDLDMAEEMMAFTKNNILQQAATAMLAQANMAPQSVLQLLG